MSVIKNYDLAESGEKKIRWVKKFMPVLTKIGAKLIEEQAFAGFKIGMSIHLEAKTAYLATILSAAGAEVFVTGCNPLSTQDDVAAALATKSQIQVYAIHGVDETTYWRHLKAVLLHQPDLIIDDGGDLLETYCSLPESKRWTVLGGCEETTTGILRLKQRQAQGTLPFPMININDARCKHYYDNRYGTGQSVWDAIMHTTNTLIAGRTVVVAGYGYCGRGIAMRARGLGAKVIITEIDPIKALEAYHDGFSIMQMDEAAPIGDYFITATGCKNVIGINHIRAMHENAFLANAGHFNVEIDLKNLRLLANRIEQSRENITSYSFIHPHTTVHVLAEGRLVNLAAGNGHPAEIMDMSFSLQALGLKYLVDPRNNFKNKIYNLPDDLDESVAWLKLETLNTKIDQLTEEQRIYYSTD